MSHFRVQFRNRTERSVWSVSEVSSSSRLMGHPPRSIEMSTSLPNSTLRIFSLKTELVGGRKKTPENRCFFTSSTDKSVHWPERVDASLSATGPCEHQEEEEGPKSEVRCTDMSVLFFVVVGGEDRPAREKLCVRTTGQSWTRTGTVVQKIKRPRSES